MLFQFNKLITI